MRRGDRRPHGRAGSRGTAARGEGARRGDAAAGRAGTRGAERADAGEGLDPLPPGSAERSPVRGQKRLEGPPHQLASPRPPEAGWPGRAWRGGVGGVGLPAPPPRLEGPGFRVLPSSLHRSPGIRPSTRQQHRAPESRAGWGG